MNMPEKEIQDIQKKYRPNIEQLNKKLLNMYSVAHIRYWYWCLSNFRKTSNPHEDIMQMDAFTTSIVIAYGRLFGKGTGTISLNKSIAPEDLKQIHENIINLRHGRYAHHGEHKTIKKNINVKYTNSSFVVTQSIEYIICLGAPKEWEALFRWIDEYMHQTLQKQLDFLTKKTGIKWEVPSGPTPDWV